MDITDQDPPAQDICQRQISRSKANIPLHWKYPVLKFRNFDLGFYLLRTGAIIYKANMAVPADDRDVVQWSNRFGSASEEDMSDILTDLNAKNTENSTKFAI